MLLPLRALPIVWCQLELAVDGNNQGRPNVIYDFKNRLCGVLSSNPGSSIVLQCLISVLSEQYIGRCP
jgi:hypothetical protein